MPSPRPARPASSERPRSLAQWVRKAQGHRTADEFLAALASGEVSVTMRDASGQTLLHHLGRQSRPDVFDAVLDRVVQRQPSLIEARTKSSSNTPLQAAAGAGNLHAVRALLNAGAQVNQGSLYDGAALHAAAQGWHAPVVDALLNAGANVHANERSVTPLNRTFYHSLDRTSEAPDLLATVDRLLAAGADPNQLEGAGAMPPMLRAIGYPSGALARLLKAGGDPNQRDMNRKTPLMELVAPTSSQSPEQVVNALEAWPLLLAAGADPNAVDDHGDTPLLLAVRRLRLDLLEPLLAAGADPHAINAEGNNALHLAADFTSVDLVVRLLAAGVSALAVNQAKETPLVRARSHTVKSEAVIAVLESAELRQTMARENAELRQTMDDPASPVRERPRL